MTGQGLKHQLTRFLYRRYRRLKRHALSRPDSLFARLAFRPLEWVRAAVSAPRAAPEERTERLVWKALYFQRYGQAPPFRVQSQRPVALDSADAKWPRGAVCDNSTNRNFNLKLAAFFGHKPDLKVLDLGCAGGGFVKSFLEDGYTAVGVEGAAAPRQLRLREWDTIPYHLFTADLTHPFTVQDAATGEPVRFDCVTAWEVLEHIPEDRLPVLFENIARHLAPGGIFVGSVDTYPDADPFTGAVYHQTLREPDWWLEQFHRAGLHPLPGHPFETRDYVRGHGTGLKDWDPRDGGGFHVVLTRPGAAAPAAPGPEGP